MTRNLLDHNADLGAQWADQRYGVDLRPAVAQMASEHAICEACIWDKLRDFDGIDDPSSALAATVQFLNAERASGLDFGSILGSLFGQGIGGGFPTPDPLTDQEKRAVLAGAGRGVTLDHCLNVWMSDDRPILPGTFSGSLAWAVAWERFLLEEEVYRHYKGGVYIRGCSGRSSEDGSDVTIYEHVWPHEPEIWVRPTDEFEDEGRFVRLTV